MVEDKGMGIHKVSLVMTFVEMLLMLVRGLECKEKFGRRNTMFWSYFLGEQKQYDQLRRVKIKIEW